MATQSQPDEAAAAKQGQVSDIIVTATRREESAQRVPVAITALSAADLQARGIQGTNDLQFQVPGLQIYSTQVGITNYTIRGLGNANNRSATADGAVGVFVNEAYIGRPFLVNTDFMDMERVEVLRGPQGTLFGRNTIGGAISFYSTKPGPETRAGGEVTIGDYNQRDAGGYISGQIADNVYAKVAVTTRNHDGYDYNTTTHTRVDDQRSTGVSAALRFTPTSNLDITLNVDTTVRRGMGSWWVTWVRGPYSGAPYADPRVGNGANDNGFGNINNSGGSLNVNWSTPIGDFTSVTAYRYGTLDSRAPSTGTMPAPPGPPAVNSALSNILFTQEDDYRTRQYSQEFRLASNGDSPLKWLLGAYYFHEKSDHTAIVDFQFNNYYGYSGRSRYDSIGSADAFALFGNVSYNITEKLKVQAGVRWSSDHKESIETVSGKSYGAGFKINGVPAPNGWTGNGAKTFQAATPSFTINYQATPAVFLYATVSKGFKSGGFNDVSDEKFAAQTPYLPETVWNYEAGFKADLFDHHARLNVSAFRLNYTNLQVSEVVPAFAGGPNIVITANAGKTHNQGVETEFQIYPVSNFQLYGNFSYQDSKVDQLSMVVSGVTLNQAGNKLPLVPKTKWMLGAAYTFPIGDTIDTTLRGAYSKTGAYFGYITNNPLELVPVQSDLTASLLFQPRDSHWNVELWGKNLENKLNISQLFQIFGASYAKLGTPRTWGLTVRYKY